MELVQIKKKITILTGFNFLAFFLLLFSNFSVCVPHPHATGDPSCLPPPDNVGVYPGLPLPDPGVGGEVVAVHGRQLQQRLLNLQLAPALHNSRILYFTVARIIGGKSRF